MNPLAGIPGLGPLVTTSDYFKQMSEPERNAMLAAFAVIGIALGYSFVKHPEILPQTVNGIGEIVKGIGEVVPL